MKARPARGFPWLKEHRTLAEVAETERLIALLPTWRKQSGRSREIKRLAELIAKVPSGCINYPTLQDRPQGDAA